MCRRILIINGSLRVNGNTDAIIKSLLKGAENIDAKIKYYVLRDKNIKGCNGCYYCYDNETCVLKDDMQEIYIEIQQSDLIILASPMYWWGVTGLMKTFIDRLYLYYPKKNGHLLVGKKLLLIMPMHVNEKEHGREAFFSEIEPVQKTSQYIFKRLGIKIIDIVFYPGLSSKDDAAKNEKYLKNSYDLGQKLAHL